MTLRFIAKDPETNGDHCPTAWVRHEEKEIVFQGWLADAALEAECLTTGPIPDNEGVIRLPFRMIQAIREACDVAEGATVR